MASRTGISIGLAVALAGLMAAAQALAMEARTEPYGVSAEGAPVEAYTLVNDRGMMVRILSHGARIDTVRTPDRQGRFANVVLGLPDLAAYEANGSFNCIIGRYANRISGGGFTLDGVRYPLPSNARGISSHGGPTGFCTRNWAGRTFNARGKAGVVLTYRAADGENGFPGALDVTVTYTLDNRGALRIDYAATTDRPTVVNLTNHAYFNLSGDAARDVLDHWLTVAADSYTPGDEALVPTGEIAPVAGGPLDLRRPARIGDRVGKGHPEMRFSRDGFDHNFMLRPARPGRPVLAARLEDPQSGRGLEVLTTEPGVQVYTANHWNGTLRAASGAMLRKHHGVALETQHVPDSPNKPQFPSTVLRPGETLRSTTLFRFYVAR